ncbi:MAG: CD1375 family protein [Stomatobaculum sp.]
MLELYIKLVKAGRRTLESVPEKFCDKAKAAIEAEEAENQRTSNRQKGGL